VERLYVLGVLDQVRYLSTVSGGSILGALLALKWTKLLAPSDDDRLKVFEAEIAAPILRLARSNLRMHVIRNIFRPRSWRRKNADLLADELDRLIFKDSRLTDLPPSSVLRVSFNATSLITGKRFRFSGDSVGDYHMGYCSEFLDKIRIATAVAASAAFPPLFSPLILSVEGPFQRWSFSKPPTLQKMPLPTGGAIALADGGLYDNIGLQAAQQRCGKIIAVDAGLPLESSDGVLGTFSAQLRAIDVMMSQIVSHPIRKFVSDLIEGRAQGVLIRISQTPEYIGAVKVDGVSPLSAKGFDRDVVRALSSLRTDLDAFSELEMEMLRYHGRSSADASLRRFQPGWVSLGAAEVKDAPSLDENAMAILKDGAKRKYPTAMKFLSRDEVQSLR
jgi:NTE family protein